MSLKWIFVSIVSLLIVVNSTVLFIRFILALYIPSQSVPTSKLCDASVRTYAVQGKLWFAIVILYITSLLGTTVLH